MTVLDLLFKASVAAGALVDVLTKAKTVVPDLAPQIDNVLAELAKAVDPENLGAVAVSAASELADIAKGKIISKQHPSDFA